MGYIRDNLLHDEKIIYWERPHWIVFAPAVSLALFSLIILIYLSGALTIFSRFTLFGMPFYQFIAFIIFLIAIVYGIKAFIMYQTSEYGITDKRIMMKTGWIQRRSIEIFLSKVEAIYVNQSVPGRFIDYGTITIVGTGGSKDPFLYIPAPLKFRNQAQQQIDIEESKHENP